MGHLTVTGVAPGGPCLSSSGTTGVNGRPAGGDFHHPGWLLSERAVLQDRKSTRLNSSHTVIYTLSLHHALPISPTRRQRWQLTFRGAAEGPEGGLWDT